MNRPVVREVNAPFTVNPEDEALGHETLIGRRNGEPVAAILPYAEYQNLVQGHPEQQAPAGGDREFERNRAAFYRLLPGLLKDHRGEWAASVNEKPAALGKTSTSVLDQVYERLGHVRLCVQEVLEQPRVYRMPGPRVSRSKSPVGSADEV